MKGGLGSRISGQEPGGPWVIGAGKHWGEGSWFVGACRELRKAAESSNVMLGESRSVM